MENHIVLGIPADVFRSFLAASSLHNFFESAVFADSCWFVFGIIALALGHTMRSSCMDLWAHTAIGCYFQQKEGVLYNPESSNAN